MPVKDALKNVKPNIYKSKQTGAEDKKASSGSSEVSENRDIFLRTGSAVGYGFQTAIDSKAAKFVTQGVKNAGKKIASLVPKESSAEEVKASDAPNESAFVKIGRAVTSGGMLGFMTALAAAGTAVVAPSLAVVATTGLIIAGGVAGSSVFEESATKIMGNKIAGKLLGGVLGAGMTALCTGFGPVGSVVGQAVKGFAIGGLFGLIQEGAKNKPH